MAPAPAQHEGADGREKYRVEITGSRIARVDAEGALPVQIISAEEIRRAGWTTAAELMANVPANFNGQNDALSVGNGGSPGLNSANLRGLGSGNTLVLLNGRRLSNYAFLGGTADLGTIPLAALDRVEILKDGASSIYGTDAIAGVVNFITRSDYQGAELTVQGAATQQGGGDHYQATITAGTGDLARDGYNAFVTLDWQKDTALYGADRDFSRTAYMPERGLNGLSFFGVYPANILAGRMILVNPGYATGCDPPLSLPVPLQNAFGQTLYPCQFDFAPQTSIIPEAERLNLLARGSWQFQPGHEAFFEYLLAATRLPIQISPTPVSRVTDPQGRPAIYPAGGPYYPTAFAEANGLSGDLQLFYRTMTLGRRVTEVETLAQRLVIGAQGTFGEWDYNVAYNHSENTSRERFTSGWVYGSKVLDALQSGLVNPWGSFDEDGQALLEAAQITGQVRKATGRLDQVDARWSGALTALPAGPLAMAFGVEGRREELTDRPSEVLDSGDVIGGVVVNPQDASREVYAAFVEFNLPLARGFEAQLSARYDHYSDFGSTTNPKVAVRWQPATSVLLRASWGTGFRAPSLPDLFTPVQSSTLFGTSFPYEDPVRCPVTQLDYDCGFDGFQGRSGGNPLLVPETSEQWGTGFVWQPLSGLSIGIDYWSIRKRNVIGTLTGDLIFGNFDLFAPTNVVRAAAGPAYPELPGPIEYVIVWGQNIGNNRTSGIDVTLRARSAATGAGSFALDVDGTYISEWTEELVGLPPTSALGKSVLAPIPRWRSYSRLRWDYGPWTATLGNRFQSGYTDAGPTPEGTTRNVGSYSLFDLQAAYAGFKDTSISVGVRNLFDRDPPFSNAPGGFQIGYDPRYADPRGRSFYARFSYAFR